jgi:peptidoglycan/LPS O-acetylase OafA/YrhL
VFAVVGLLYDSPSPAMLAACYSFLQTWVPHHQTAGLPPAWTLGSEVLFYLSLPRIAARLERRNGPVPQLVLRDLAIGIAALWLVRVLVVDVGAHILPVVGEIDSTFFGTADMFLVGMALSVVSADPGLRARAARLVPRWRIAWPVALGVYLLVTLPGSEYDVTQWSLVDRVWEMTLALLLIAPLVLRANDAPTGLVARGLAFVGLVSYGIYIWHYPVVVYLKTLGLPEGMRVAASFAAAFGMGTASYFGIERRFMVSRRTQQPTLAKTIASPAVP